MKTLIILLSSFFSISLSANETITNTTKQTANYNYYESNPSGPIVITIKIYIGKKVTCEGIGLGCNFNGKPISDGRDANLSLLDRNTLELSFKTDVYEKNFEILASELDFFNQYASKLGVKSIKLIAGQYLVVKNSDGTQTVKLKVITQ